MSSFTPFEEKMRQAGQSQAAIDAFRHSYDLLVSHHSGMIEEKDIQPAENVYRWEELTESTQPASADILSATVCIKLNGGLGTGMGLKKAKSLLPIKGDVTFLDVMARQVIHMREQTGAQLRLLLMNSFSTSEDTLAYMKKYEQYGLNNPEEMELMQNQVPKILADSFMPASTPGQEELEWCPPGHGDLYPALLGSGWLEKLLEQGIKYAFVSNSDNLGAELDLRFLRWFAESDASFVMEVTQRTEADKKGGHIAVRKSDNHLVLRELAQCPEADIAHFQDITKYKYFNTNTLWIKLESLSKALKENGGNLPLPVIQNKKTLDPRDANTPMVYQLETAMGAGIECFSQAQVVCVPRTRFFPVKTCSDLFLLRSDAIVLDENGHMSLHPDCKGKCPIIDLDAKRYKLVDSLESLGMTSLRHVEKLVIRGDIRLTEADQLSGSVILGKEDI